VNSSSDRRTRLSLRLLCRRTVGRGYELPRIISGAGGGLLAATIFLLLIGTLTDCHHTDEPPVALVDTTSHNFIWTIETLGDGNSSRLCDVTIINDTLAYAVGIVNVFDSTGDFQIPPYNLARWNGKEWELSTVIDSGFTFGAFYSIYAFGPNDIWMGSAGTPGHWDGKRWKFIGLNGEFPGGFYIMAIGGTSSRDLYMAGSGGNISRFDGAQWIAISSGTSAQIQDLWAGSNPLVGSNVVLAVAGQEFAAGDRKILRIKQGGAVDTIGWQAEDQRPMHSVWFTSESQIFLCGTGVFSYDGQVWNEHIAVPFYFTQKIRGNSSSDIVVVGDLGLVAHFNGSTWHTYPELMLAAGQYNSVAIKGNTVIAVGALAGSSKAVVARGVRIQ